MAATISFAFLDGHYQQRARSRGPYRGRSGRALTDLLGDQVQVLFAATPGITGYIRTGALRALAVTTATRAEVLPCCRNCRPLRMSSPVTKRANGAVWGR